MNRESFHNKYSKYRLKISYNTSKNVYLTCLKTSFMSKNNRIKRQTNKKLVVVLHSNFAYGYGDILYLNKIANILYKKKKHNKMNINIIITFDEQYLNKFNSVSSKLIKSLYRPLIDVNLKLACSSRSAKNVVIQVATPDPSVQFPNCKYIYLDEYNGHRSIEYDDEFEKKGINIVSGIGNNHLKDCSGIIFETFEREYNSLKKKDKNMIVDKLENFFFAYNSGEDTDELEYFINIVAHYYGYCANSDLKFLIVWKLDDNKIEKIFLSMKSKIDCGVIIKKVNGDETEDIVTMHNPQFYVEGNKRIITIYLIDFLHPVQFTQTLKKSNDLVMVTGDQSFSEAIKFNKLIIYQCQEWKIGLFEQYLIFVRYILGKKSLLYNFILQQYNKFIISSLSDIYDTPKINITYLLDNMKTLNKEILTINNFLHKNYNIEHVLLSQNNSLIEK